MTRYIILAFGMVIFSSCADQQGKTGEPAAVLDQTSVVLTEEQRRNTDITTSKIERRALSSLLRLNGLIEVPPQNMVSVSVAMGGYLTSTRLLPGMHISRGEIIARLEDQQYIQLQQDYLTARARFQFIEKEYLRQRELNQSKASSDKVFEAAQAEYTTQKVLLKSLDEKLRLIYINPEQLNENTISRSIAIPSPIDGFVSSVKQNIGKYVSPTDVLFDLVNPEDIHLQLTVFEKDLYKLAVGQQVVTFTNSHPEKKYHGEIILIGKDFSPDRTVEVHCHFDRYDKTLIPGMYMNAEVEVATDSGWVVPEEAIVQFGGKQYVFAENGTNTFSLLPVTVKNNEWGLTQLSFEDGVKPERRLFVTRGAYSLLMKMKNQGEE